MDQCMYQHMASKITCTQLDVFGNFLTQDGNTEVAVKVVRKEFFKQDPKVRENLEREIRILKLLRGCEYVVQILHVQVSVVGSTLVQGTCLC